MEHKTMPLSQRRVDWIFVSFFLINFFFITYTVDIEQIIIPDTTSFQQRIWPSESLIRLIHWYGNSFDPLLFW